MPLLGNIFFVKPLVVVRFLLTPAGRYLWESRGVLTPIRVQLGNTNPPDAGPYHQWWQRASLPNKSYVLQSDWCQKDAELLSSIETVAYRVPSKLERQGTTLTLQLMGCPT
jgi:hypothetical protein